MNGHGDASGLRTRYFTVSDGGHELHHGTVGDARLWQDVQTVINAYRPEWIDNRLCAISRDDKGCDYSGRTPGAFHVKTVEGESFTVTVV